MEFEELQGWLQSIVSPLRYQQINDALTTLQNIDHTGVSELVNNTLSSIGDKEHTTLLSAMISELIYLQLTQIREFSIAINHSYVDSGAVYPLDKILSALYWVGDNEDKDAVTGLFNQEEAPELLLALLVEKLNPDISHTDIVVMFDYVPITLIDKILEENKQVPDELRALFTPIHQKRLIRLLESYNDQMSIGGALEGIGLLGMPVTKYIGVMQPYLTYQDTPNIPTLAANWIVIHGLTTESDGDILANLPDRLNWFYDDTHLIQSIYQQAKKAFSFTAEESDERH